MISETFVAALLRMAGKTREITGRHFLYPDTG